MKATLGNAVIPQEERPTYTSDEMRLALSNKHFWDTWNCIGHVIAEENNKYSLLSHIVCEHCDICDEQGDVRCLNFDEIKNFPKYREDIYKNQEN